MRRVSIENRTHPTPGELKAEYCDSFVGRFRGLMFRKALLDGEGLLLVERSDSRINAAIHMLFMNFDIAAVWIDSQMRVVDVQLARRWHPSYVPCLPARFILETHPEYLSYFQIGDQVTFRE
jgi:uncharacterized membrane protein (UPF0127 family)